MLPAEKVDKILNELQGMIQREMLDTDTKSSHVALHNNKLVTHGRNDLQSLLDEFARLNSRDIAPVDKSEKTIFKIIAPVEKFEKVKFF